MKIILIAFLTLLFFIPLQEKNATLILNATAVLGNGDQIENAVVAFKNGEYTLVGDATRIKLDMNQFEATFAPGKYLYPLSMVKEKLAKHTDIDTGLVADSLVVLSGEEASFAILHGPLGQENDSIISVYLKGEEAINSSDGLSPEE